MIDHRGLVDTVFFQPAHPYTQALLSSVPKPEENTSVGELHMRGSGRIKKDFIE
jgi:ABC-type oligopeptide transport system ATPase subunit